MGYGDDAVPADADGLALLAPDDLMHLGFRDIPAGSLSAVARLTGLKVAVLGGAFTDDELGQLAELTSLGTLMLMSEAVEGSGLTALAGLPLESLTLYGGALSPAGFARAAGMQLPGLSVQIGALEADHLDAVPEVNATALALTVERLDVEALVRLIHRSPALRSLSVYNSTDPAPLLDEATVLALRVAHPELTVNGTWYAPDAVSQLAKGELVPMATVAAEAADPIELTVDSFDEVIAGDTPVLVDFTAEWCGPCKALAPTIREITGELAGRLIVGELDIDHQKAIAERYSITAVPALLVFRGGEQVARIGSQDKDGILSQLAPVL